ncbi:MAG TPA: shikimate dehydrogenase, partial [Mariprofundaceae bacterium]|nr:shikimate dehydrogenase [Mariprofundaceae bacterium]
MEDVEISGKTKVFGIMGYPVEHSLSPIFQAEFLRQFSIDGVYVPFAVAPGRVHEALDGLMAIGVEGFNVTVPHKESVCEWVRRDADAGVIGAVNTVRRGRDGVWDATNTDWRGFAGALQGLGAEVKGGEILLFGAGGTARAVLHALAALGARIVHVCNRGQERLAELLAHARRHYPDTQFHAVAWDQGAVETAARTSRVAVNTTSIGMGEASGAFPFGIGGDGIAVDTVYAPGGLTAFCAAATRAGRRAVDGLPMLVAQ